MNTATILEHLAQGRNLTQEMAETAFTRMMSGELTPAQTGSFLMGMRRKGETAEEMAAAVACCLKEARAVNGVTGKYIDPVGTGGDGKNSFNCSTATALTLAGMGYQVVKHGNRAVSSTCGSADAVEGLGLPLEVPAEEVAKQLALRNFVFLFAPAFHPAFKYVVPVRKELGIRTMFNMLGPLLNPSRPTHQLLGVARPEHLQLMAEVLALSGIERAAVVHGAGGYDEMTPMGPADVVFVENGKTRRERIDPVRFGINPCNPEDLAVHDKEKGLSVLRELLSGGGNQAMQDMLTVNTGMCVHLLEDDCTLEKAMKLAREAVLQGAGERVINA